MNNINVSYYSSRAQKSQAGLHKAVKRQGAAFLADSPGACLSSTVESPLRSRLTASLQQWLRSNFCCHCCASFSPSVSTLVTPSLGSTYFPLTRTYDYTAPM